MIAAYIAIGFFGILFILIYLSIVTHRLRWAMRVDERDLPPVLLRKHTDWWPWLQWIPRKASAFVEGIGGPIQLFGTNPEWHHQDVPQLGTWCISWPFHVAVLTAKGTLFGFGVRRDYYDKYWTLRAVWRKN